MKTGTVSILQCSENQSPAVASKELPTKLPKMKPESRAEISRYYEEYKERFEREVAQFWESYKCPQCGMNKCAHPANI